MRKLIHKLENFDYLNVAFISNQNFQFYCATIADHVGLIAESNRSVEGLQLRLEDMSIFLRF